MANKMTLTAPETTEASAQASNTTDAASQAFDTSALTQIQGFMADLSSQLRDVTRRLDERDQAAEALLAPPRPERGYDSYGTQQFGNGPLITSGGHGPTDLSRAVEAGLIPPPPPGSLPQLTAEQAMSLVAFIPKDDPLNPRNLLYETWINGRLYRSRRGQTMMLPRGHAIMLAASDHGYVVDIELMSGLTIPRLPDYSRPSNWDGSVPVSAQSSVPSEFYQRAS